MGDSSDDDPYHWFDSPDQGRDYFAGLLARRFPDAHERIRAIFAARPRPERADEFLVYHWLWHMVRWEAERSRSHGDREGRWRRARDMKHHARVRDAIETLRAELVPRELGAAWWDAQWPPVPEVTAHLALLREHLAHLDSLERYLLRHGAEPRPGNPAKRERGFRVRCLRDFGFTREQAEELLDLLVPGDR